jgi:hypothetical protein
MPITFSIKAISRTYPDIAKSPCEFFFEKKFFILIGIFYPAGEPILLHLLRYSPFAVDDHSRGQALSS